jgi:hypothetical protein
MTDVIFVAVVLAFFAIAAAYVKGCARIVGDDDVVRVETDDPGSDQVDGEVEEVTAA